MEAITDMERFFIFEDCDFCGQLMEPSSLELRNMLEDYGIVRFDFCPCCGSQTNHVKDDPAWRSQVTRWMINRRIVKK